MIFSRALPEALPASQSRLLDEFFLPYLAIRNRRAGYAVSIVKTAATLVGQSDGRMRAPLTDLPAALRDDFLPCPARSSSRLAKPPARRILPALPCDPQPPGRLCGEHRQDRGNAGGTKRRTDARTADRSACSSTR